MAEEMARLFVWTAESVCVTVCVRDKLRDTRAVFDGRAGVRVSTSFSPHKKKKSAKRRQVGKKRSLW